MAFAEMFCVDFAVLKCVVSCLSAIFLSVLQNSLPNDALELVLFAKS